MAIWIDQNQGGVFLVVQNLVEILEMQSQILTIFIVQKDVIKKYTIESKMEKEMKSKITDKQLMMFAE